MAKDPAKKKAKATEAYDLCIGTSIFTMTLKGEADAAASFLRDCSFLHDAPEIQVRVRKLRADA